MNKAWHVTWTKSSEKYYQVLNKKHKEKFRLSVLRILDNPFHGINIKKLHGKLEGLYRYKTDALRIIYRVLLKEKTIRIIVFDARGSVY